MTTVTIGTSKTKELNEKANCIFSLVKKHYFENHTIFSLKSGDSVGQFEIKLYFFSDYLSISYLRGKMKYANGRGMAVKTEGKILQKILNVFKDCSGRCIENDILFCIKVRKIISLSLNFLKKSLLISLMRYLSKGTWD